MCPFSTPRWARITMVMSTILFSRPKTFTRADAKTRIKWLTNHGIASILGCIGRCRMKSSQELKEPSSKLTRMAQDLLTARNSLSLSKSLTSPRMKTKSRRLWRKLTTTKMAWSLSTSSSPGTSLDARVLALRSKLPGSITRTTSSDFLARTRRKVRRALWSYHARPVPSTCLPGLRLGGPYELVKLPLHTVKNF